MDLSSDPEKRCSGGLGICRDDRELHRGNDGFFRSESDALVWGGLVGLAVADDRRRTSDWRLDGVLQEEVFAETEDRRGVILQIR